MGGVKGTSPAPKRSSTRPPSSTKKVGEEEVGIAAVLLRKDLFEGIRAPRQLETLVARAIATVPQPYSMILCRLLGYHPDLSEKFARQFWEEILAHREELAARLDRPIHLRVAALDLIALGRAPDSLAPPILIGPHVLKGLVDAARLR